MRQHSEEYFATYTQLIRPYAKDAKTLLEIGCGGGVSTYLLAKSFPWIKCQGSDISQPQIKFAHETYILDNLDYSVQNAISFNFDDNSFSIVTSFDLIEHLPNIKKALLEQMRIVEPEGFLIIKCPHHMSPLFTMIDIISWNYRYPFTKTWLDNFGRIFFEMKHYVKAMRGEVRFVERLPDLSDCIQIGSDADAVNDMSLITLENFFKYHKWKIVNRASPRSKGWGGKLISIIFPGFASIGLVAKKTYDK